MNSIAETGLKSQINSFHRFQRVCDHPRFKPVQYMSVSDQFEMTRQALKEEKKFLNYIAELMFPIELPSLLKNML